MNVASCVYLYRTPCYNLKMRGGLLLSALIFLTPAIISANCTSVQTIHVCVSVSILNCTMFIMCRVVLYIVQYVYQLRYNIQLCISLISNCTTSQPTLHVKLYCTSKYIIVFFWAILEFCKDCPSNKLTLAHEKSCCVLLSWFLELTYICT